MATRSHMTCLPYGERVRLLARDAQELIREHEQRQHGGERCLSETINLLAYLAHAVGVVVDDSSEENVKAFICRVRDYGAVHKEHNL